MNTHTLTHTGGYDRNTQRKTHQIYRIAYMYASMRQRCISENKPRITHNVQPNTQLN